MQEPLYDYTITEAVQHPAGCVMLTCTSPDDPEPFPYALYPDDPYGAAPKLRVQLAAMVAAGEIEIKQPPEEAA